jgi:hypothetical protein
MSSKRVGGSGESMTNLPAPGDTIFKINPGDARERPIHVEASWAEYARQYEHAAHLLLSHSSPGDVTIYPAIFLFRHYLELQLKAVVALGIVIEHVEEEKIEAKKAAIAILNDHDLQRLTKRCRDVCKRLGLLKSPEFALAFDAFQTCVHEMSSADPGSYSFRYPTDKQLNPALAQEFQCDLDNLDQVMAKMSFLLRTVWVAADHASQRIGQGDFDHDWTDDEERMYRKSFQGIDEIEADQESTEY